MNDSGDTFEFVAMGTVLLVLGAVIGFWFPVFYTSAEMILWLRIFGVVLMAGGTMFFFGPIKVKGKNRIQYDDTW